MEKRKIVFKPLKPHQSYGKVIKEIYYVVDNNRSEVMQAFRTIERSKQGLIIDLISKMATVENYKSDKITWNLIGYNYGEIRPKPHRFFFFQKCGNNLIFFGYADKDQNSLGDRFYKSMNKKKEKYEDEFKKYIQRH